MIRILEGLKWFHLIDPCPVGEALAEPGRRDIRGTGAFVPALAFCLASAMSLPANAEADGPDRFRVIGVRPGNTLTIRSGPSTDHDRIGRIPAGSDGLRNRGCEGGLSVTEWQAASAEARVAAINSRWCRIEYGGAAGWVAGRHLAESALPASSGPTLRGTAWRLAASGQGGVGEVWIRFSETGTITGNTGCNRIQAGFESSDFLVAISVIAVTRMACLGKDRAARESAFLKALERTARFTVTGDTLTLRDEANAPLLTLERRAGN
jgi:heat shock protein HslJ